MRKAYETWLRARSMQAIARSSVRSSFMTDLEILRAVMGGGTLRPHFQPKFDMSGNLVGVEALARWWDPARHLVMPGTLVCECEKRGASSALARQMAVRSLRFSKAWAARMGDRLGVAINVQPQVVMSTCFLDYLEEGVQTYGVKRSDVTVEIVEDSFAGQLARFRTVMTAFRDKGYRLSIDDFGTGASSLQRLLDMPVDEMKVASCFVHGVSHDRGKAAIVESVMALAVRLNVTVVLDGIEDKDDLAWLQRFSSRRVQVQGFHLARPMLGVQMLQWQRLRQRRLMAVTSCV